MGSGLTGQEIRNRLAAFCARWSVYDGSERAEAQTFLNELFACYGTARQDVARFEEAQAGRFLDLIWPGTCIVEMKAPKEARRLAEHREQALDYWRSSSDATRGVKAARWVVVCAFRRLEIWEPGAYPTQPRLELDLVDLPERYRALHFLAGEEPLFSGHEEEVTRTAVAQVADLYVRLSDRVAAPLDVLRDFLLQCVWCMFGEDLGLLEERLFTTLVDDLRADAGRSSADDLGRSPAALCGDDALGPRDARRRGRRTSRAHSRAAHRPHRTRARGAHGGGADPRNRARRGARR